eukprot:2767543-Pyramimonas_sp.AAC.1
MGTAYPGFFSLVQQQCPATPSNAKHPQAMRLGNRWVPPAWDRAGFIFSPENSTRALKRLDLQDKMFKTRADRGSTMRLERARLARASRVRKHPSGGFFT